MRRCIYHRFVRLICRFKWIKSGTFSFLCRSLKAASQYPDQLPFWRIFNSNFFKLIPFQLIQRLPRKWLIFCLFTNLICHLGKHTKKVTPNLFINIFEWNSNIIESFRSNPNYWCSTIWIFLINWLFFYYFDTIKHSKTDK